MDEQTTHSSYLSPHTSYWEDSTWLAPVDFLIVGAGITGINAAISIKGRSPSSRVVVLDRGSWGEGASFRNAGFACLGSPTELLADLEHGDVDLVWQIVEMRFNGLQQLTRRVRAGNMEFRACGGVEFFPDDAPEAWQRALDRLPELDQCMRDVTGRKESHFMAGPPDHPFKNGLGQILISGEGRIHPGRMMVRLHDLARSLGVVVLGGVQVTDWTSTGRLVMVHSSDGRIWQTHRLGLATNGFTHRLLPELPVRPARNQVYLTEPIPDLSWDRCFHAHQGYIYARRVGDRLLIGGARHLDIKGETTDAIGTTPAIEHYLLDFLHRHFPVPPTTSFTKSWSGVLGVGSEKLPIIREVGQNIFAAVRLGGMGIAIGSLVGDELAIMMTGS